MILGIEVPNSRFANPAGLLHLLLEEMLLPVIFINFQSDTSVFFKYTTASKHEILDSLSLVFRIMSLLLGKLRKREWFLQLS